MRGEVMRREAMFVLLFYRSWAPLGIAITAACVWTLVNTSIALLPMLLILKLAVLGLTRYVSREYGDRTLCYFTNRGIAPRRLWGYLR